MAEHLEFGEVGNTDYEMYVWIEVSRSLTFRLLTLQLEMNTFTT